MEQNKIVGGGVWKAAIAVILSLGVIALGVLAILRDKIMENDNYQISVTAEGKATAKPDVASLTFGVQTETKSSVVDAVKDGNDRMNKVISELKSLSIEDKDIKTTYYNINPVYSYDKDTSRQRLDGYQLIQNITVKVRNLDIIGNAIQKAVSAGANQTNNINFTIDDPEALKTAARAEAIEKAKEKAKELENASGVKLGKLVGVYEGGSYDAPVYSNNFAYAKDAAGGSMAGSVPDIQSGEMEIKVNMTLTYKIK